MTDAARMTEEPASASTPTGKLPPMTALEFAIASTFRHFFFGLALALIWALLLAPLAVAGYYLALQEGPLDVSAPKPMAIAAAAVIAVALLLAVFSISVNWHRRLVLNERPRRLAWIRLNGVVWRYLFACLFVLGIVVMIAAAAYASATLLPAAVPQLGAAARPVGIALAVLLGFSALFTWYRLSSWLPAVAVEDRDYTFGKAWKMTRRNRIAYLSYTFWLVFTLAIAAALGAGAFFAQQALNDTYVTAAAFAFLGVVAWLAMFLILTIATSHYYHFSGRLKQIGEVKEQ